MSEKQTLFRIRNAEITDAELIVKLIKELAEFEKLSQEMIADSAAICFSLFEQKQAECILAFENEIPVGFALFFYNYSTFLGKKGLYLEDLFVRQNYRKKGYGKALIMALIKRASDENCGRMEWSVLDWNQHAIDFYTTLGANAMNEWTTFRLTETQIKTLAQQVSF